MSEFGDKIKSLRMIRDLTVKQVCQEVGIPQSRLSEMERGVRLPTTGQISNLENYYGVGSGQLAGLDQLN